MNEALLRIFCNQSQIVLKVVKVVNRRNNSVQTVIRVVVPVVQLEANQKSVQL